MSHLKGGVCFQYLMHILSDHEQHDKIGKKLCQIKFLMICVMWCGGDTIRFARVLNFRLTFRFQHEVARWPEWRREKDRNTYLARDSECGAIDTESSAECAGLFLQTCTQATTERENQRRTGGQEGQDSCCLDSGWNERVIGAMTGIHQIVVKLLYGSGLHEMQGGHDPSGAFGMYRNTPAVHFRDGKREKADRKEKCSKTGERLECRL